MFKRTTLITLMSFSISFFGKADTWDSPKIQEYFSENRIYMLIVTPRVISEKYYEWQYYKRSNLKLNKTGQRRKERFIETITEKDTILTPCNGKLYQINGNDTILLWDRKLLNEICPDYSIISNDGSSVVTFDNWYSKGYGFNVMVVYNEKGDSKRSYKLEEITPYPLNDYFTSISSIWWKCGAKYIDDNSIEICFQDVKEQIIKRTYNILSNEFEK